MYYIPRFFFWGGRLFVFCFLFLTLGSPLPVLLTRSHSGHLLFGWWPRVPVKQVALCMPRRQGPLALLLLFLIEHLNWEYSCNNSRLPRFILLTYRACSCTATGGNWTVVCTQRVPVPNLGRTWEWAVGTVLARILGFPRNFFII